MIEESHEIEARKEYREMTGRRNPRPHRSVDQGRITSKDLFSSVLEATQIQPAMSSNSNFFCLMSEEMPSTTSVGGADEGGGGDVDESNAESQPAAGDTAQAQLPEAKEELKDEVKDEVKEEIKDEVKSEVKSEESDEKEDFESVIHPECEEQYGVFTDAASHVASNGDASDGDADFTPLVILFLPKDCHICGEP